MRISDWSSDVCSSDLRPSSRAPDRYPKGRDPQGHGELGRDRRIAALASRAGYRSADAGRWPALPRSNSPINTLPQSISRRIPHFPDEMSGDIRASEASAEPRSEEHTSELQSLMRI